MKTITTFLCSLFLMSAVAQVSYMEVNIAATKRGDVPVSAATLLLSHGSKKEAYKALAKDLKKTSKDKIMGSAAAGTLTLTNATWKTLNHPEAVQVLANFSESASGLLLQIVLADSNNRYLELNETEIGFQLTQYLTTFGHQLHLGYLDERLKVESKELKNLKGNVKDQQRNAKKAEKNIVGFKSKIENLNEDIKVKKAEQERLLAEITAVDRRIAATNPADGELLKAAQKEKDALEKGLKNSRKAVDKFRKNIFDFESKISDAQNDIKAAQVAENTANSQVEDQQKIVDLINSEIHQTKAMLRAQ
jgi:predicted  nucleic acid-binding Zn-ribbon protein